MAQASINKKPKRKVNTLEVALDPSYPNSNLAQKALNSKQGELSVVGATLSDYLMKFSSPSERQELQRQRDCIQVCIQELDRLTVETGKASVFVLQTKLYKHPKSTDPSILFSLIHQSSESNRYVPSSE